MAYSTLIFLLAILAVLPHGYHGCCSCGSSGFSSCCSSGSSSCCSSGSSSCCSNCCSSCQTPTCYNTCQQNCCTAPVVTSRPSSSPDGTTPAKIIEERVCKDGGGGCVNASSSGTNTLIANVTSTNTINNVNHINMSINVNSNIVNNISGGGDGDGGNGSVKVITITEKVPVPVPVTVPCTPCPGCPPCDQTTARPPVPPPPTHPTVIPPRPGSGCCIIVVPCVIPGCNPYHYRCHGCQGNMGYLPINPCSGGCYRRSHWDRESCGTEQCVTRRVDCSSCHQDFYMDYGSYSRCHGCFYGGYGGAGMY